MKNILTSINLVGIIILFGIKNILTDNNLIEIIVLASANNFGRCKKKFYKY